MTKNPENFFAGRITDWFPGKYCVLLYLVAAVFVTPVLATGPDWTWQFPNPDAQWGVLGQITFSPDNQYFVTTAPDGSEAFAFSVNGTLLWNYTPENTTTDWTKIWITGVSISPDSTCIGIAAMLPGCCHGVITNTPSNKITVFDRNGSALWNFSNLEPPRSLAMSNDGQVIFAGYATRNFSCIGMEGSPRWNVTLSGPVSDIATSAEGNYILAGGENIGGEFSDDLYLLTRNGTLVWKYQTRGRNTVGISPDAQAMVVLGDSQGNICARNLTGEIVWKREFSRIGTAMAQSGNGNYIVAGTDDNRIHLLDDRGDELWDYRVAEPVTSVALSDDADTIVAGTEGGMYILNKSGALVGNFTTTTPVRAVGVSSDGTLVAGISDRIYFFHAKGNGTDTTVNSANKTPVLTGKTGSVPTSQPAPVPGVIVIFAVGFAGWRIKRKNGKKEWEILELS
jgi:WD40 repeat protein